MQRRRVLEMLGSFVLGGAFVAGLYELGGRTPVVATEALPEGTASLKRVIPIAAVGGLMAGAAASVLARQRQSTPPASES